MAFVVLPGADASGNGNDWTANNINNTDTSSTTYDIMKDVPTLTNEDTANFCTLSPITCPEGTISNGNLTIDHNGSAGRFYLGTMGMSSGKWYFEAKVLNMSSNSRHTIGFCKAHESYQSFRTYMGGSSSTYHCLFFSGAQYEGTTIARTISSLAQPASGTIINVAIDVDNNKVFFGKNGTWQNSGNPVAGTGQCINLASNTEWILATGAADNSNNSIHNNDWDFNFGQRPFAYTPPTGYKKLNTYNLPDSSIEDGSKYFDTKLWTGNGTSQTISGLEFAPDLVWGKSRSTTGNHVLVDSIRGDNTNLNSNLTNAESSGSSVSNLVNGSFDVAGGGVNASSVTMVGWSWRASDSAAVSNTDGTITSTVSANTTSGFSIATFTGNGLTAQTIGHGLSQPTELYIWKRRDATSVWGVTTTVIDGSADYLNLNSTVAAVDSGTAGQYLPTSTTQYISFAGAALNASGGEYVCYSFHSVEGFSKIGSYTGNGSTDGTFVYTGFRPAFIIFKRTDTTSDWNTIDTARNTYNLSNLALRPNTSGAESTYTTANSPIDFISNGFKLRGTGGDSNASGGTYIYMAFAENPFKNSLAR